MEGDRDLIRVLFVCHGNICRSTMAEFVMKDLVHKAGLDADFEIASAATSREEIGNDIHPGTKAELRAQKIPYTRHLAVQMTKRDYEHYDLIIAMDNENLRGIERIVGPDNNNKVKLLLSYTDKVTEVADPWYTGDFEATYDDIKRGCKALLEKYKQK